MGLEICTICVNCFGKVLGNSSSKWEYKEVEGFGGKKGKQRRESWATGVCHVALRGCDSK